MTILVSFLVCAFHAIPAIYGYLLDESSLIDLVNIKGFTIDGFGFQNVNHNHNQSFRTINPLLEYLLEDMCDKMEGNRQLIRNSTLPDYPDFQNMYSKCQKLFKEDKTCFSTCIFHGIIERDSYGKTFLLSVKSKENLYFDESAPFPHMVEYEFHTDDNIFCFSKEYRAVLLDNTIRCNLASTNEFCIIDEDDLHCDSNLGNCDFDETEASVINSGNRAHVLTCGSLDTIKWKYFENSTKPLCILPRKNQLLQMYRKVFKNCKVCSNEYRKGPLIKFLSLPTKEEFAKVAYSAQPILIRNGANYERMQPLNYSFITQIYQDLTVGDWQPCKFNQFGSTYETFAEALAAMREDSTFLEPWYILWGICLPEIQRRFGSALRKPSFLPDDYPIAKDAPWIYTASPGGGIMPHMDYFRKLSWQAQLSGRKVWTLGGPPECNHICTDLFQVTVKPGDLFNIQPNSWLHGILIPDGDPSIAILTDYDLQE